MGEHPAINRIFCIGRNYPEHIRELSNERPARPVIFLKPASCMVRPGVGIHFPSHGHDLQHEAEIVVRIGRSGRATSIAEAYLFINAFTIGLDLTLRDLQSELKGKGLPWEISKAFEQSAPMGDFIPFSDSVNLADMSFECSVNGVVRQSGNTRDMLFSIGELVVAVSSVWTLQPGDCIYTGTPAGVGPLRIGDAVEVRSGLTGAFNWHIIG